LDIFEQVDPYINYSKTKVVIFDVDGTLYNQQKLRLYMLKHISFFLLKHPLKLKEIRIIIEFRKQREIRSGEKVKNIETAQYLWAAEKCRVNPDMVKKLVNKWIYEIPLQYLKKSGKTGLKRLFKKIKNNGIKIAIYSDYPAKKKIQVLGLSADLIISSIDKNIDCFKPDPKAVFYILKKLGINKPEDCLFVGDRYDKDQACADNARIVSLIIK
jgi:putative hydrolase of the HAD superfamily